MNDRTSLPDNVLHRSRLFQRLAELSAPIFLIAAPSGFGKTTLLRSWITTVRTDHHAVLWVPFSRDITTPTAFWAQFLTAARRHEWLTAADMSGITAALELDQNPIDLIATHLTRGRRDLTVVLDSYEHVNPVTAEIDRALLDLVVAAPDLRIVITTRGGTSLLDLTHRLRGRVSVIEAAQLRFTQTEVAQLLSLHGWRADAMVAKAIHQGTQGYPLAIRAATIIAPSDSDFVMRSRSHWQSLTADTLVDVLPTHWRQFVLDTCVPPYFDIELAANLSSAQAEAALAWLDSNGFGRWIPYASGRRVFQYVVAIRDALLFQVADHSHRHRRACALSAEWLSAVGDHETALGLAVTAQDYQLATSIYRRLVITRPESYLTKCLDQHLARIPDSALREHPVLAFGRGVSSLSNSTTRAAAPRFLTMAATTMIGSLAGLGHTDRLLHHGMRTIALRVLGRVAESAEAAHHGLEAYHDLPPDHRDHEDVVSTVLRHFAYSMFRAGDQEGAASILAQATSAAHHPGARNLASSYAAGLHAFDGRRPEARAALDLVDDDDWSQAQPDGSPHALCRTARATLLLDEFDFDGALAEYAQCRSAMGTTEYWPLLIWTRMMAQLGGGHAAEEAARVEGVVRPGSSPIGLDGGLVSDAIRGLLAILWQVSGRPAKSAEILSHGVRHPGQLAPAVALKRLLRGDHATVLTDLPRDERLFGHTVRSRSALLTLAAAAAVRTSNDDLTAHLLHRVSSLVEQHGPRAHLTYVPTEELSRLGDLARERRMTTAEEYLSVPATVRVHLATGQTVILTKRERAVLSAFLEQSDRSRVARTLHVSENTVKSQLRSIYRKMGVNDRQTMIQKAVELDLELLSD